MKVRFSATVGEEPEVEVARLRISGDVMEGKAGAFEEDERLREHIVELTRGLMSAKKEQGGGGAAAVSRGGV